MSVLRRQELRCFCQRRPLLGMLTSGDERGVYFHVKAFKGQRLFTDIKIFEGTFDLCCRECLRWHSVSIINNRLRIGLLRDRTVMVDVDTVDPVISAAR